MAGTTENSPGLLVFRMTKLSPCADSSGGPLLMALAQLLEVSLSLPAALPILAPAVKLGASFTGVTVMVKVCAALPLVPPLAEPPSSCNCTVIVGTPLDLAAVV